jgi:hypothetical protein
MAQEIPKGFEAYAGPKKEDIPIGFEAFEEQQDTVPSGFEVYSEQQVSSQGLLTPTKEPSGVLPGAQEQTALSPLEEAFRATPKSDEISETGGFGAAVRVLAKNFLLPQGIQDIGKVDRTIRNISVGGVSSAGSLSNWVDRLFDSETARQFSNKTEEWAKQQVPVDPGIMDEFEQAVGSSAFFVLPGILIAGGTSLTAGGLAGLGVPLTLIPILATLLGVSMSTILESGAESGGVYKNVLDRTGDKKQARAAADKTFFANVALVGATNYFGIFGNKARGLVKAGLSSALEGIQEMGQTGITSLFEEMPAKISDYIKSFVFGAVIGAPASILSDVVQEGTATDPVEAVTSRKTKPVDVMAEGNSMKEKGLVDEETEVGEDVIAKTEEATARAKDANLAAREALIKSGDLQQSELELAILAGVEEFRKPAPAPTREGRVSFEDAVMAGLEKFEGELARVPHRPRGGFPGSTGIGMSMIRDSIDNTEIGVLSGKVKTKQAIRKELKKEVTRVYRESKKQGIKSKDVTRKIHTDITRQRNIALKKVQKDAKYLKKAEKDAATLPTEYRSLVGAMTRGMDFNKRTAKTLENRGKIMQRVNELVRRGVDIGVPLKTLRQAYSKPLQDMTPNEITVISNAVRAISHEAKTEKRLLRLAEKQALDGIIDHFVAETKDKPNLRKPITEPTAREERTLGNTLKRRWREHRRLNRRFWDNNNRQARMLEELDGQIDGPIRQALWTNGINKAENVYSKFKLVYEKQMGYLFNKHELQYDQVSQEQRFVSEKVGHLGIHEIIGVYNSLGDEKKMQRLMESNNFNEQDISDIVSKIAPNEKAFADEHREVFWDRLYDEVNPVYEAVFGIPLPRNAGFSHMVTSKKQAGFSYLTEEDLMGHVWGKPQFKKQGVDPKIIKERLPGAKARVSLSYIDTFFSAMDQAARFRAFAEVSRDIRKILVHPEFRKIVDERMGPHHHALLDKWLIESASGKLTYQDSLAEHLIALHRKRFTTFLLGYRVVSAMKAPISFINATMLSEGEFGQNAIPALNETIMHYGRMKAEAYEYSPQLAFRAGGERDLKSKLSRAQAEGLYTGKEMSPLSLRMYKHTDEFTVIASWHAAKRNYMQRNPNADIQEAADYALDIVLRTQPAPALKDLPRFFKEGEIAKQLTFLGNQRNQNSLSFSHDIGKLWRLGAISTGEALRRLMWLSVVSYVYGTIARGRFDRTLGEAAGDLVGTYLGGIFFVGNLVVSAANNWDLSAPLLAGGNEVIKTVNSAVRGEVLYTLNNATRSIALFYGLPMDAPQRQLKGVRDIITGEDERKRRIIGYSKKQLDVPGSAPLTTGF